MSRDMLYSESVVHRSGGLPMKIYESCYVKYHWHDEYEFLLSDHDDMRFAVGGRQITLNLGDALMIRGGELHSIFLDGGKSITAIVVHPKFWVGEECAELFEELNFNALFTSDTEIGRKISELLRCVKDCYDNKPYGYEFLLRSYFSSIFAILLENGEYSKQSRVERAEPSGEVTLFEYVYAHLGDELSLDTLSDVTHYSKSYIIRLFKKNTGQTPTEYINRCCVEMAKELLKTHSVTDTALSCGFYNVSYYIKIFKRYAGTTPKQWRES